MIQRGWSTFLKSHARAIVKCDFFVAVTAFRILYVLLALGTFQDSAHATVWFGRGPGDSVERLHQLLH